MQTRDGRDADRKRPVRDRATLRPCQGNRPGARRSRRTHRDAWASCRRSRITRCPDITAGPGLRPMIEPTPVNALNEGLERAGSPKCKAGPNTRLARSPVAPGMNDRAAEPSVGRRDDSGLRIDRWNSRRKVGNFEVVHPRGFEPLTFGSVDRCSIQLSYGCNSGGKLSRKERS
jgi:hypothetical protein